MRKFVVSDLHGDINSYNAIMGYLDNIAKEEEVILYINGDLIDKGIYSVDLLLDVKKRIETNSPVKIVYLGGDHEWAMIDSYHIMNNDYKYYRDKNIINYEPSGHEKFINTYWAQSSIGGSFTKYHMEDTLSMDEIEGLYRFVKNLKIYQKLPDMLNNKQIVISHASCPKTVLDNCNLTIDSVSKDVMNYIEKMQNNYYMKEITDKEQRYYDILCLSKINRTIMEYDVNANPGSRDFFTIIGHTPVNNKLGYEYSKKDNVINIDGGNASYWSGNLDCDHIPLVEIDAINNRLIILTFNHNNEIIYGTYFNGSITNMPINDLDHYRSYLNSNAKMYKLDLDLFRVLR